MHGTHCRSAVNTPHIRFQRSGPHRVLLDTYRRRINSPARLLEASVAMLAPMDSPEGAVRAADASGRQVPVSSETAR